MTPVVSLEEYRTRRRQAEAYDIETKILEVSSDLMMLKHRLAMLTTPPSGPCMVCDEEGCDC